MVSYNKDFSEALLLSYYLDDDHLIELLQRSLSFFIGKPKIYINE